MSKFKFKIGDKVRVRKDLEVDHEYKMDCEHEAKCCFVSEMAKLRGKIVTINGLWGNCRYLVKESSYYWVDEMFEPVCKFKVGDYVVCNTDIFCTIDKGWVGKVVKILPDNEVKVAGLYTTVQCDTEYFDLYTKDQPNKIVITTDGKTTTAKMYRDKTVVGVQTTKCHPDDRFDFMVGARVAFDRLVGEKKEEPETPKYYNGKVVCVDTNGHWFYTKGKVYQFVDGMATNDAEYKFSTRPEKFKSFDEFQAWSNAKWLEVVE